MRRTSWRNLVVAGVAAAAVSGPFWSPDRRWIWSVCLVLGMALVLSAWRWAKPIKKG